MAISYRAAQNLIKRGDQAALRAALAAGLNPQAKNENGWTLLMLTAVEGNVPMAQALLERGVSTNNRNAQGQTALAIAESKGRTEFAAFLRAQGASAS